MGFFEWLCRLFGHRRVPEDRKPETIADVADRLDRYADRYSNANDIAAEQAARSAARAARQATTLAQALAIERRFLASRDQLERSAQPRVARGVSPQGSPYVAHGGQARVGGSRGWRNNNPGYIRCGPEAMTYGAIGCDGEYAIFPDEAIGRAAMTRWLTDYYPTHTLGDALRQQLPAEAGQGAAAQVLEGTGLAADSSVRDLSAEQLQSVGEAAGTFGDRDAGEQFQEAETAPDWLSDSWSAPAAAEADAEDVPVSDNS